MNSEEILDKTLDEILYQFSRYVAHHEKTGLAGKGLNQLGAKRAIEVLIAQETKKAEVRALKPIREICDKLDNDYRELDALDDIEKYNDLF